MRSSDNLDGDAGVAAQVSLPDRLSRASSILVLIARGADNQKMEGAEVAAPFQKTNQRASQGFDFLARGLFWSQPALAPSAQPRPATTGRALPPVNPQSFSVS